MCDHCSCRQSGPIADLTAEHDEILGLAWKLPEDHDEQARRPADPALVATT